MCKENVILLKHIVQITQVCPPGLHISLGIFYRLFLLLENKCHELDLRVREEDSVDEGGTSYSDHVKELERENQLKLELEQCVL